MTCRKRSSVAGWRLPVGLPADQAARLRQALELVANDPEFSDQANASGFLATWIDGADWTTIAATEQRELAELWATEPWLQEGAG